MEKEGKGEDGERLGKKTWRTKETVRLKTKMKNVEVEKDGKGEEIEGKFNILTNGYSRFLLL